MNSTINHAKEALQFSSSNLNRWIDKKLSVKEAMQTKFWARFLYNSVSDKQTTEIGSHKSNSRSNTSANSVVCLLV